MGPSDRQGARVATSGGGEQAAASRKRAAVETYARHQAALRRTARRFSLCEDDAEDALQRGLEILLRKAPSDDERELIRWTQTVVKHEALAVRRERERILAGPAAAPPVDADEDWVALIPASADGPPERAERREAIARSREALRALKPQELRALTLLAEGYSYREIGEITGFSPTKINRCLAEGRERFRGFLARSNAGGRCAELQPLLSAFCDGEAGADEATAVREHLRACAHCRATLRAYRAAPGAAAALAPALPAGRSLLERAHETLAGLLARFGGGGAGSDATVSQVAAAGGARGAGAATLAKVLAVCVGTVGGAATCAATGVDPRPDRRRRGPGDDLAGGAGGAGPLGGAAGRRSLRRTGTARSRGAGSEAGPRTGTRARAQRAAAAAGAGKRSRSRRIHATADPIPGQRRRVLVLGLARGAPPGSSAREPSGGSVPAGAGQAARSPPRRLLLAGRGRRRGLPLRRRNRQPPPPRRRRVADRIPVRRRLESRARRRHRPGGGDPLPAAAPGGDGSGPRQPPRRSLRHLHADPRRPARRGAGARRLPSLVLAARRERAAGAGEAADPPPRQRAATPGPAAGAVGLDRNRCPRSSCGSSIRAHRRPLSGIRGYAVALDSGSGAKPCAGAICKQGEIDLDGGEDDDSIVLGPLAEGTNLVRVVAVSGSGLHSAVTGTARIRVDGTPPSIAIGGAPDGWSNRALAVTATASDELSGMAATGPGGPLTAIAVDGGAPSVAQGGRAEAVVHGDGAHLVTAFARDAVGNLGARRPRCRRPHRLDRRNRRRASPSPAPIPRRRSGSSPSSTTLSPGRAGAAARSRSGPPAPAWRSSRCRPGSPATA